MTDALGLTASAVKSRLHRARQALRTLLEAELEAKVVPTKCTAVG